MSLGACVGVRSVLSYSGLAVLDVGADWQRAFPYRNAPFRRIGIDLGMWSQNGAFQARNAPYGAKRIASSTARNALLRVDTLTVLRFRI